MNFGMIDVLVSSHTGDIGRPGVRSRIGFALVEAGLRLQVTAPPISGSGHMRLNERSYYWPSLPNS